MAPGKYNPLRHDSTWCRDSRVIFNPGAWLEERKAVRKSIRKGEKKKPKLDLVACDRMERSKSKSQSCEDASRKVNQGSPKS